MKEIMVMGRKIEIKLIGENDLVAHKYNEKMDESMDVHAWYAPVEQRIYIYSGLEPETFKRVLIHELFHVLMSISGQTHYFDDKQEEALADLAENFLELFQNKKFIDYLGA